MEGDFKNRKTAVYSKYCTIIYNLRTSTKLLKTVLQLCRYWMSDNITWNANKKILHQNCTSFEPGARCKYVRGILMKYNSVKYRIRKTLSHQVWICRIYINRYSAPHLYTSCLALEIHSLPRGESPDSKVYVHKRGLKGCPKRFLRV